MIPLRDDNPTRSTPVVNVALIALCVIVFLWEIMLPGREAEQAINLLGFIPAVFFGHADFPQPWIAPEFSIVTSMFMHGGWMHLLGNMLYLWIFGDNVEDEFGHVGFLGFYFAGGIVSAVIHSALNADSPLPTVGASGAIAAVLGAYAVFYPRARVLTLVPIVIFIQVLSLPALLVLGLWFVVQFFSGALSLGGGASGGIAWWAHIGGFAFGMVMAATHRRRQPSRAWVED